MTTPAQSLGKLVGAPRAAEWRGAVPREACGAVRRGAGGAWRRLAGRRAFSNRLQARSKRGLAG